MHNYLRRAAIIPDGDVISFTSDSGGDMAKCAEICMKELEDGIIPHACGAHNVQLLPKLLIFTELYNKGSKRRVLIRKGGRQLSDREFDDLVHVRVLIDKHFTRMCTLIFFLSPLKYSSFLTYSEHHRRSLDFCSE
jgi:hypothetical protein